MNVAEEKEGENLHFQYFFPQRRKKWGKVPPFYEKKGRFCLRLFSFPTKKHFFFCCCCRRDGVKYDGSSSSSSKRFHHDSSGFFNNNPKPKNATNTLLSWALGSFGHDTVTLVSPPTNIVELGETHGTETEHSGPLTSYTIVKLLF